MNIWNTLKKALQFNILLLVISISLNSCILFTSRESAKPIMAKDLTSQGKYDQAIELYNEHIKERVSDENRPKVENPYFYFLLIGDIYILKEDPINAVEYYKKALNNKVEKDKFVFRIIKVSKFLTERKMFEDAIKLLNKYKDLDPLGIGFEIDRVHRKFIENENEKRKN